jgi:hypothetical protein
MFGTEIFTCRIIGIMVLTATAQALASTTMIAGQAGTSTAMTAVQDPASTAMTADQDPASTAMTAVRQPAIMTEVQAWDTTGATTTRQGR